MSKMSQRGCFWCKRQRLTPTIAQIDVKQSKRCQLSASDDGLTVANVVQYTRTQYNTITPFTDALSFGSEHRVEFETVDGDATLLVHTVVLIESKSGVLSVRQHTFHEKGRLSFVGLDQQNRSACSLCEEI
jgi:hypothetical protein